MQKRKTLSKDQVIKFLDNLIGYDLYYSINHSNSVNVERSMNSNDFLDEYRRLKLMEQQLKDHPELLNIAHQKMIKFNKFLLSMFAKHEKVDHIIPDLTLFNDQCGKFQQIFKFLTLKNFNVIGISLYFDNQITYNQFFLFCNFQQLINTNKADIVYITPTFLFCSLELSFYLEKFNHAYLKYNNTNVLEAFVIIQSNNNHLTEIQNQMKLNSDLKLYEFGQENSNIVIAAGRKFDVIQQGLEEKI